MDFACAGIVIAMCTAFSWFLRERVNLAALATLYLLGLVGLAMFRGGLASAMGALLGALFFDFFLETPPFQLTISRWPDFLVFSAQLGVAQLVAYLMEKQRAQTRLAQARESEAEALFTLSRALGQADGEEEARRILRQVLGSLLNCDVTFVDAPTGEGLEFPLAESDAGGACLAFASFETSEPHRPFLEALVRQARLSLAKARLVDATRRAEREAEAERTRSTLLAALGHDLRTPLSTLGAAASTLALSGSRIPPEESQELARMVQEESRRLSDLVEGLLEYTRLEGGALVLHAEWVPLDEILGVVLARAEAVQQVAQVELALPPGIPLIFCDGVLVEELLANLLSNAQRHAPGSPARLEARLAPGTFSLSVCDRGPGIAPGDRKRIFGKFERAQSGMHHKEGLGLGLAICRAIVEVHGGRIWVEDAPGGGACFRVDLPQPPLPAELGG